MLTLSSLVASRPSFEGMSSLDASRLELDVSLGDNYGPGESNHLDLPRSGSLTFDLIFFQSLALALFFASRGIGSFPSPSDPLSRIPYTSKAKVLLSGLGADE